jgi:hypothetical protein
MSDKQTVLTKLRFREWLDARRDLTDLQRRVGGRLVSLYNVNRGMAWPSYKTLADDLGATERGVMKSVAALVEKGLFAVRRRGGRGHANEYVPAFASVPAGCPYEAEHIAAWGAERVNGGAPFSEGQVHLPEASGRSERVNCRAERVNGRSVKGEPQFTPSCLVSDLIDPFRSKAAAASAEAAPSQPTTRRSYDPMSIIEQGVSHLGQLQALEREIKAGCLERLSVDQRWQLRDFLDETSENNERHDGNPIGGMAFRLAMEVEFAIGYDEDGRPVGYEWSTR